MYLKIELCSMFFIYKTHQLILNGIKCGLIVKSQVHNMSLDILFSYDLMNKAWKLLLKFKVEIASIMFHNWKILLLQYSYIIKNFFEETSCLT